jgi:hypothetical protein
MTAYRGENQPPLSSQGGTVRPAYLGEQAIEQGVAAGGLFGMLQRLLGLHAPAPLKYRQPPEERATSTRISAARKRDEARGKRTSTKRLTASAPTSE